MQANGVGRYRRNDVCVGQRRNRNRHQAGGVYGNEIRERKLGVYGRLAEALRAVSGKERGGTDRLEERGELYRDRKQQERLDSCQVQLRI